MKILNETVRSLPDIKTEILFRASGIGALMTDAKGAVITEKQLKLLNDFQTRLREGGKITPTQAKTVQELTAKKNAPFKFSDTATSFMHRAWLLNTKGFYKALKNKYVNKGIFGEEVGFSLLTEIDGRFYNKNTERITKGHITGECDSIFKLDGKVIIQDVKCCWDAETFMDAEMDKVYEWQGRSYMHLYDADEFWLRYCLVDCPDHLVRKEQEWKWREFYSDTMDEDVQDELENKIRPLLEQIERNLVYSTNPAYSKDEMVKTIKITRDDEIFKTLLKRIPPAVEYYKKIKLNQL
ncbi:MAG: hypothetical protein KAR20_06170 [Candidatus Heimdallarchaeota archaeon]|nr:hypothetical protein [Candidatus Heimdallarchaeota archaeon]